MEGEFDPHSRTLNPKARQHITSSPRLGSHITLKKSGTNVVDESNSQQNTVIARVDSTFGEEIKNKSTPMLHDLDLSRERDSPGKSLSKGTKMLSKGITTDKGAVANSIMAEVRDYDDKDVKIQKIKAERVGAGKVRRRANMSG